MVKPALVIMAAGIGSRYGGIKQIDPIGPGGEMIIDYSIYDALRAGFGKIIFVIKKDIEEIFRERIGRRIERVADTAYVFQAIEDVPGGFTPPPERRKPWGTGHAVLSCRSVADTPFAVVNADDFYGAASFQALSNYLRNVGDQDGKYVRYVGDQDDKYVRYVGDQDGKYLRNVGDQDGKYLGNAGGQGGKYQYCMVGFRLENTLTEHGHVARGICVLDREGNLLEIRERTKIQKFDGAVKYTEDGEKWFVIPEGRTVSMNAWGFTPSLFNELDAGFSRFLESNRDNLGNAEYFLPSAVSSLIEEGKACVKVLPTWERWYGVTYREDKPVVVRAVSNLVKQGVYPGSLWEGPV